MYSDAVGDLDQLADPVVSAKWGPSIGEFQIRSLRHPDAWGADDRVRVASKLRDPAYNAYAAFVISKGGADWSKWTAYRSGSYLPHVGKDYTLVTGHPRAHLWNS